MGGENIEVVNKFTLIVILIVFFCCCFKRDFFKFVSMPQIISICEFFSVTRVFSIPTITKVIAVLLDFDKRVTNLDSINKWWRHVAWCKYKIYLRKGHESRRKKQFWFKTSFQHILVVLKYFFIRVGIQINHEQLFLCDFIFHFTLVSVCFTKRFFGRALLRYAKRSHMDM